MEKANRLTELPIGCYLILSHLPLEKSTASTWLFAKNSGLISTEIQLIPFLSLKDNLLLGVKKKERCRLEEYLQKCQLSSGLLERPVAQLSHLERIQLQMLRQLLQHKDYLLIDHCDQTFSIKQTQAFLLFCKHVATTFQVSIVLISADEQLAQTPYFEVLEG